MSKISAIVLTKNSEAMIADCLDSVSFCDELIVVDDFSTDRTPDLAKHLGARVFKYKSQSFADKRNFGQERAKYKWIIYIDDDERVSKELEKSIKEVISGKVDTYSSSEQSESRSLDDNSSRQARTIKNAAAYKIKRKNFYFGNHEWPQIEEHVRLFNKSALREWKGKLHESPVVEGEISDLDGFLLHYTHRDLASMVEKTAKWSKIEAELRFKSNHPKMNTWRFLRVMFTAFYDSYIKQKGYKAGTAGLVESMYQSYSIFITYARLWELQNKK